MGAPAAEQRSALDAGALAGISVYGGSCKRIATESGAADAHVSLMLKALEFNNKVFEGAGAVRRLAADHAFTLTQHDRFAQGECRDTVLAIEHEGRNNYQPGIASASSAIERGTYRNLFTCVRDSVAIVPAAAALPCPPTAPGAQSAMVVGLPNPVVTSNRDHEVKVQFAWQRGQRPNSGGTAYSTDGRGNAPGDHGSGTWVRVSEALAGPNWGSVFTPHIGTEVLVDFIEGDNDRPVVVG